MKPMIWYSAFVPRLRHVPVQTGIRISSPNFEAIASWKSCVELLPGRAEVPG